MLHRSRLHCHHNDRTLRLCNRRPRHSFHRARIHDQAQRNHNVHGNTHLPSVTIAAKTATKPRTRGQKRYIARTKGNTEEKEDTQEEN